MAVSFAVAEDALGRPESSWRRRALDRLPVMSWGPPGRAVVVAPHPDDEVLGVGGTMAVLVARGWSVEIVAVSDGEGSHPHLPPAEVAAARHAEVREALHRLGLGRLTVHRLGLPDGGGGGLWDGRLAPGLGELLDGADLCLSTWRGDGHPDHESAGEAAAAVCGRLGVRLVEYPVWAWHWDDPADPVLPLGTACRTALGAATHAAKLDAVRAFPSQAGILPERVLDRFRRPFEVLLP